MAAQQTGVNNKLRPSSTLITGVPRKIRHVLTHYKNLRSGTWMKLPYRQGATGRHNPEGDHGDGRAERTYQPLPPSQTKQQRVGPKPSKPTLSPSGPTGSPLRASATATCWMRQPHPCYRTSMDDDTPRPPPSEWLRAIARSDADLAAGRIVPASVVHAGLNASIARLEAAEAADKKRLEQDHGIPHRQL